MAMHWILSYCPNHHQQRSPNRDPAGLHFGSLVTESMLKFSKWCRLDLVKPRGRFLALYSWAVQMHVNGTCNRVNEGLLNTWLLFLCPLDPI
jgi:hypothetical protein